MQDSSGTYTLIPNAATDSTRFGNKLAQTGPTTSFDKWRKGKFTIIPEDNIWIDVWDVIVIFALMVTAVELPFEVALIEVQPQGIYMLGKMIDSIFICDICLNFNVAYAVSDPTVQEQYERDPFRIASHYMAVPFSNNLTAGWFWPDLLTVIPFEMLPLINDYRNLRLVRVVRLIRMLRLVRVLKLFKRWHTYFGFSFALVKVTSCACTTLLLVHWLACVWGHLGLFPYVTARDPETSTTWLEQHARSQHIKELDELTLFEVYSSALYFCVVVLVTVGFGDILPVNEVEVMVMIATIFTTGITWAWVVANVVNVITNMDVFTSQFNQIMDDLNALMHTHQVDFKARAAPKDEDIELPVGSLRHRIRKHLHESYPVHRRRHNHNSIKTLSKGLQGELAIELGVDEVCRCVWWLRDIREGVLIEIASCIGSDLFSPAEFLMDRNCMQVIRRGTCIRNGKVLSRDAVIGEDMILLTDYLRDTSVPRTLTFCEVMTLGREDLRRVCLKFPEFDRRLRRAQVKMALWRAFVHVANQIKRALKRPGARQDGESLWDSAEARTGKTEQLKVHEVGWSDSMRIQPARRAADDPATQALMEIRGLSESLVASCESGDDSLQAIGGSADDSHTETMTRLNFLEKRFETMQRRVEVLDRRLADQAAVPLGGSSGSAGSGSRAGSPPASKTRFH